MNIGIETTAITALIPANDVTFERIMLVLSLASNWIIPFIPVWLARKNPRSKHMYAKENRHIDGRMPSRKRLLLISCIILFLLLSLSVEVLDPKPLDRISIYKIVFNTGALFFIMLHETIMNIVYALAVARGIK